MRSKSKLSVEQIEFACNSFQTWLGICEANNKDISASRVENSWLLRRLLSGKSPLSDSPPERFGMPAWELVDRDEIEIEEFHESEDGIVIDGHPGYSWVDKERRLLRYDRLNLNYEITEVEQAPAGEPEGAETEIHRAKILRRIK